MVPRAHATSTRHRRGAVTFLRPVWGEEATRCHHGKGISLFTQVVVFEPTVNQLGLSWPNVVEMLFGG